MDTKFIVMILSSFIMALIIAPFYINWLKTKQFGQYIREDGPKAHLKKTGTPTMGAVIYLLPVLILFPFFEDVMEFENLFLPVIIILFAIIGGIDDVAKVFKKQNEGLTSKQKFGLQVLFSLLLYVLFLHGRIGTELNIPFINQSLDMGLLYPLFVVFLFVGASNATNLTDGLDGLLTGNAIVSFLTFGIIAHVQGDQVVFTVAMMVVATLFAFLLFNFNPARIFMGDMGSLVLGALMVGMAILLKVELLLVLVGMIYVIETLSVIMQVASFKLTGKRIFKMSPIHHHFELNGMKEKGIFVLFVGTQVMFSALAIFLIVSTI